MKLFCFVLAGVAVFAKTPHKKSDFDEMDEKEHQKLDREVFEFDGGEFDVNIFIIFNFELFFYNFELFFYNFELFFNF